jgi:hypothetical protein
MRCVRLLLAGWRAGPADVIILSELELQFAWVAWLLARLRRAPCWIDFFVGMYETNIEDWGECGPNSLRARLYRAFDALALRSGDAVFTDTRLRAQRLRVQRPQARVLSLPAGAPEWAVPETGSPREESQGSLRLLFYGSYLPLHGVPFILEGIAIAQKERPLAAVFVGSGGLRAEAERRCSELGLQEICAFRDPVPEPQLAALIAESDVVLGIFGQSEKAATVIANKVWQGLACERFVVTRESAALLEIRDLVSPYLIEVSLDSPRSLADALCAMPDRPSRTLDTARLLAGYVDDQFEALAGLLPRSEA